MALIELREVGKRFDNGTVALERLSLSIDEGQFVSLLGPSGCGKSTVLRLMAGLESPSQGQVSVTERSIGFVFQEPTLMPWATVAANVSLPLRLAGCAKGEVGPRVDEALNMVGLTGFSKVLPRELSGGMKMRVSIARAMVTRPRLLLMDEPFAALDEMTRLKLNDDVLALWRGHGLTVVFVTHSVYESVYLSNRIVVMAPRPGRSIAEFAVDEPHPRDEDFRTTARYGEHCRMISRSLRSAVETRPTAGQRPEPVCNATSGCA